MWSIKDGFITSKTGVKLCNHCKLPDFGEEDIIGRQKDDLVLTLKGGKLEAGNFFWEVLVLKTICVHFFTIFILFLVGRASVSGRFNVGLAHHVFAAVYSRGCEKLHLKLIFPPYWPTWYERANYSSDF